MKKVFIYLAAFSTILVGCAKEMDKLEPVTQKGKEQVTIYATIDNTKSTVDNQGAYSWQSDETIAVVEQDAAAPVEFTLTDAENGAFTGQKTEGKDLVFAVSPAAALTSASEASGAVQYVITFPDTYTDYVPGTTNDVMIGTPTGGSYKFNFSHAAALLKFTYVNVPVGTKKFVFDNQNNFVTGAWTLNGLNNVTLAEDGNTFTENGGSVTLVLKDEVSQPNTTLDFFVPVPVSTYKDFAIKLQDKDGNTIANTKKSKSGLNISLKAGDIFVTPTITLAPVESLAGNYIIVSKAATKDKWVVMKSGIDANGRWSYDETSIEFDSEVDLTNSSIHFSEYSNSAHKFVVEAFGNGYVLKDFATNKYIEHFGGSNNKGKEVDDADKAAFDVTAKNADGTWTLGSFVGETPDTYSLQYNVGNYFSFYKSIQAPIYLIPYVGNPEKVTLSISCEDNLVTITALPSEAEIYYTLDGTTPTSSSTHYTAPFSITQNEVINAIAIAPSSDYIDSDVVTENVTWVDLNAHVYYVKVKENLSDWSGDYLFVYEDENVAFNGSLTDLDVVSNGYPVTIDNNKIEKTSEIAAKSFSIAAVEGGYSIQSASGKFIGNSSGSNGLSTADTYSSAYLNTISYANNTLTITSKGGKTLSYNSTTGQKRFRYLGSTLIQAYKLQDNREQVATPSFSVPAGEVSVGTPVELACTTAGATIHYTTDGSKPSSSSPTYSTAIVVNKGMTIKAIAVKDGFRDSEIASASYTVPVCATPSISIDDEGKVTITCSTDGAEIHYTTDGSTPNSSSTTYTSQFTVSDGTTVKAIATKSGSKDSEVTEETYSVGGSFSPVSFSWTQSEITSGYTFTMESGANKSGYVQDKSSTEGLDLKLVKSDGTALFSTSPTTITLKVTVGGGSTKNPLTNNVVGYLIDSNGNNIVSTATVVTSKVENTNGKEYTVTMPLVSKAYGIRVSHAKESSYNIRIYGISFSAE